jgi:hypothetical protein
MKRNKFQTTGVTNINGMIEFYFGIAQEVFFTHLSGLLNDLFNCSSAPKIELTNKQALEILDRSSDDSLFLMDREVIGRGNNGAGLYDDEKSDPTQINKRLNFSAKTPSVVPINPRTEVSPGTVALADKNPTFGRLLTTFLRPSGVHESGEVNHDNTTKFIRDQMVMYKPGSQGFTSLIVRYTCSVFVTESIPDRKLRSLGGGYSTFLNLNPFVDFTSIDPDQSMSLEDSFHRIYESFFSSPMASLIKSVLTQIILSNPKYKDTNFRSLFDSMTHRSCLVSLVSINYHNNNKLTTPDYYATVTAVTVATTQRGSMEFFRRTDPPTLRPPFPYTEEDLPIAITPRSKFGIYDDGGETRPGVNNNNMPIGHNVNNTGGSWKRKNHPADDPDSGYDYWVSKRQQNIPNSSRRVGKGSTTGLGSVVSGGVVSGGVSGASYMQSVFDNNF